VFLFLVLSAEQNEDPIRPLPVASHHSKEFDDATTHKHFHNLACWSEVRGRVTIWAASIAQSTTPIAYRIPMANMEAPIRRIV